MDKRQRKTRHAIYYALDKLLQRKKFSQITIQNIIDEAKIGRSTFYCHYKTKEDLISAMCRDLFEHILEGETPTTKINNTYEAKLVIQKKVAHILSHLKDSMISIKGLITGDMSGYFYSQLYHYYFQWCDSHFVLSLNIPSALGTSFLSGCLIELCRWFFNTKSTYSCEDASLLYINTISSIL